MVGYSGFNWLNAKVSSSYKATQQRVDRQVQEQKEEMAREREAKRLRIQKMREERAREAELAEQQQQQQPEGSAENAAADTRALENGAGVGVGPPPGPRVVPSDGKESTDIKPLEPPLLPTPPRVSSPALNVSVSKQQPATIIFSSESSEG